MRNGHDVSEGLSVEETESLALDARELWQLVVTMPDLAAGLVVGPSMLLAEAGAESMQS